MENYKVSVLQKNIITLKVYLTVCSYLVLPLLFIIPSADVFWVHQHSPWIHGDASPWTWHSCHAPPFSWLPPTMQPLPTTPSTPLFYLSNFYLFWESHLMNYLHLHHHRGLLLLCLTVDGSKTCSQRAFSERHKLLQGRNLLVYMTVEFLWPECQALLLWKRWHQSNVMSCEES